MERYRVSSLREGHVDVDAADWLSALGAGLRQLGLSEGLTHMAAETLPGGKILVRDVRSGAAYSVVAYAADGPSPVSEEELLPIDEDEITASGEVEDLAESVLQASDVDQAVTKALSALRQLVPSASGSVLRADTQGWLRFVAFFGPGSEKLEGMEIPPHMGVAGFCMDEAKVITLRDAYADARFFRQIDRHTGTTTRNLLCVPLVHLGVAYGCIEMLNVVGGSFTNEMLADADRIAQVLATFLSREPVPVARSVKAG